MPAECDFHTVVYALRKCACRVVCSKVSEDIVAQGAHPPMPLPSIGCSILHVFSPHSALIVTRHVYICSCTSSLACFCDKSQSQTPTACLATPCRSHTHIVTAIRVATPSCSDFVDEGHTRVRLLHRGICEFDVIGAFLERPPGTVLRGPAKHISALARRWCGHTFACSRDGPTSKVSWVILLRAHGEIEKDRAISESHAPV